MASEDVLYQNDNFVSASINADYPHAELFIATFFDDGFVVTADDKVIWECNVYDTIIHEHCELFARGIRLEVKLRKQDPKIYWTTLRNEKKANSSLKIAKHNHKSVVSNPNYKRKEKSNDASMSHASHDDETINPNATKGGNRLETEKQKSFTDLVKTYSKDDTNAPKPGASTSKPPNTTNQVPPGSRSNFTSNPFYVPPGTDPLSQGGHNASSEPVNRDPQLVYSPPQNTAHNCVSIEFHCLLSVLQWGLNDYSKVFIRFASPVLGGFNHCYGPMNWINSSEDGYVEFCYVMKVPLHVFENHNKGHRKYKYHVESPLTQKRTITSLEFIAGVSNAGGGLIDRYLKLHLDLNVIKKNQSTCKHYDGIIWPEVKDKSFCISTTNVGYATRAKNALVGLVKGKSTTAAGTPSSDEQFLIDIKALSHSEHAEYRTRALSFYLHGFHNVLYGPEPMDDPINVIRTVHAIYASLDSSYVFFNWREEEWKLAETKSAMYQILTFFATSLLKTITDNPRTNFLVKMLALLLIFYKCRLLTMFCFQKINRLTICGILMNLAVKDECSFKIICSDFFVNYEVSIGVIMDTLITNAVKCSPPIAEWIFAVPMLHFMTKKCKPYEQLRGLSWNYADSTSFQWGNDGVLQTIPQTFPGVYFEELQKVFRFDPYLLRLFVFVTNLNTLLSLSERLPVSVLIMRLTTDCRYVIKDEIKVFLPSLLVAASKPSNLVSSEEDTDILKSSLYFLNNVLSKTKEFDEDFFVNVIKLVLCALSRKSFSQEIRDKVISNLEEFLYQISHRIFRNKEFSAANKRPMQLEVQYWNRMINLECKDSVAMIWKKIVTKVITKRLPLSAQPTHVASILIEMDSCNTPAVITDCVLNHLLNSVEHTAQQSFELKSLVKELLKSHNISIGLLSIIDVSLLKVYSREKLTISDLLEWNLWPKIFSVFVKSCSVVLADIKKISEIVHSALIVLIQFCKSIISAKICMYDLVKCQKNMDSLQALCNAANSGKAALCSHFDSVKSAMELCFKKFSYVEQYSKKLEVVVKHCSKISKDVTKSMSCELKCDLKAKEINNLCVVTKDGGFKCIHFSSDKLPPDMVEHFIDFDNSQLFESIWNEICDKLDEESISTFTDIYEHAWKPTIEGCKNLLYKLRNKTFTYSDIKCFTDRRIINSQMTALYNAMYKCYDSQVSSLSDTKQWIPLAVRNVTMYLDFTRYSMKASSNTMQVNAVGLCLKLKELLKLKGDFSVIDNLNNQINTSEESSFANIDVHKVELWTDLRDVYGDPAFQTFYETLCDTMILINWLREETRDHDHLKCFVHVGKSTAKNNFEKGILSNLYDVGEGLAPIIFNLPENTGFDEFYSKCILVLDALKRRSYLTNNMKICTNNLDKLKAFKNNMGSFDFSKTTPLLFSPPDTISKDFVWIKFLCLVSTERWGFNDSSKIYLRFASPELGTFYTCHGPMTRTQILSDYYEYQHAVKIPISLLKDGNAEFHKYKYHVESPATESGLLNSLEFIVGPTTFGDVIDRYLKVNCSDSQLKVESIYKRFDGIILPEHKVELPKPKSSNTWLFGGSTKESSDICSGVKLSSFDYNTCDLKLANHKVLRKDSLMMHLQSMHEILVGTQLMDDPVDCVEVICSTYLSLHKYYLCYKSTYGYLSFHDWEFNETTKEMETWLLLATHSLTENIKNQPNKSFLRNILCLLIIYTKLNMLQDFCHRAEHSALISTLLRNLVVDVSSVLEAEVKCFWNGFGQLFQLSLLDFVNSTISVHTTVSEWIFAIPLVHLVMRHHKDLNNVEWNEDPSEFKYQWGDDWWSATQKRKLQWTPNEQLHKYFQELQPLFKIDPLLLRFCIKVIPLEDLHQLICKVPTSVLLMRLAEEFFLGYQETLKEVIDFMSDALGCAEWIPLQSDEDISIVKTSLFLFKKISSKLSKNKDCDILIKPIIKLCLVATLRVCSSNEILENILSEIKERVASSLKQTLRTVTLVKTKLGTFILLHKSHGKAEIQYWSEMFELQCADVVKDLWHNVCKGVMIERLPKVSTKHSETMSIFNNIDFSQAHDKVTCCILDYLIQGIQQFGQKDLDDDTGYLTGFQKLVEKTGVAENVVSLFNKLLHNKYPKFTTSKTIHIQDLLSWSIWPDIIIIFVRGCATIKSKEYSLQVDDLKETSEIVHAALLELNKLYGDINKGMVTGKEVEDYRKQTSKLRAVYEAANIGNTLLVPQFAKVSTAIQVCMKKLATVKEYRSKLVVVVNYCKRISEDLVKVICQEVDDNSDNKLANKRICNVCEVEDDGSYKYICFSTSKLENEMIHNIFLCGKYNDGLNKVFEYCWNQQRITIATIEDVSYDSVYKQVWKPTIEQCQTLLCKLKDKTITLEEAESLYQIENFSAQLSALCNALCHCYPKANESLLLPNNWVSHTIAHIALYHEIVDNPKCTQAAEVIIEVRTSLKLEGDFKIIESLAKHRDANFKKQTLVDVNEQLIHKWIVIRNMYSNTMLHKCLEVFSKNTSLVFWLREATNDVSQLASFVEVCNSTAGEEEFNMKRLSYLHSVGSNFASLIYELPNDANFNKFDEKCKMVENLLENNPKLAESLEECNKHLDWFKELKATQGSFEVTAISKVNDINQWGEYIISSSEEMPLLFIGDAIKLKIHRPNAVKPEYSLDDLRDLESKLVLITGKHAAGKVETDKFLNYLHLVCRISNALLALQNAGHARYITWSYSFHCEFDVYSVLDNQAIKMENELKKWNDEIAKSRNNFHVLNLFTTQQLRVIRQQLGQLNCERISSLPPTVISMLMSISPKICEKDIKECLQSVKDKTSLVGHHLSEKSEDLNNLSSPVDPNDDVQLSQFNPENEVSLKAAVEKWVMLLISHLDDVEKSVYEVLKGVYPDEVVYLSIKNCCDGSIEQATLVDKASAWCLDNVNKYEDIDPQVVLNELKALNTQNNASVDNEQNTQLEEGASVMVQSLDDSVYEMEQMLIDNDIPSGLAREAAERYSDDIEKALAYCLDEQSRSTEQCFLSLPSTDGNRKNPYVEHYDVIKVNEYMQLDNLAKVLNELIKKFSGRLIKARKFNDSFFNLGEPNLVLAHSGKVLKTALSLYCELNQPFPSMDEVVICTSETTTEDIVLLWRRAIWDPGYMQIFCLLFAEKLSYKVCDESLAELDKLSQGKNEFRIVIICSSESEETSHVVSKLLQFKRDYAIFQKDKELAEYLKHHFKNTGATSAAFIDADKLSVRVVSSEKPGMGKSLHVKKLAEKLRDKESYCIVPVHGPVVDFNTVMKLLQPFTPSYESPTPQIIHMDIDSEVLSVIDTVLFSLLILKSLKDKNGNVWRFVSSQLYMIEVTYCESDLVNNLKAQQESTLSLLQLLPSIKCAGPDNSLKPNQGEDVTIDRNEFKNKAFQCVFQYLRRFDARMDLSSFIHKGPSVEGDYPTCISTIKKYCSIVNPSWAELAQFIRFLYVQLNDCQSSIYCNQEFFGKGTDFKTFVVEFMIRMSQDFAMRSLEIAEDSNGKADVVSQYQVKEGREWDKSQHPYIFFNQDHMTMTFVGFKVDENGQCSDFKSNKLIKDCQVPLNVCKCLQTQGVNLQKEDCSKWTKKDMIDRLCRVFGVDYAEDPDDSYVLTSDNFLKMMAIHMRFRCDIPVVIMGETGCGKTRLIRYMCDLQTCDTGVNNLVMLKVHGGTSEEDISKAVANTEELAKRNCKVNSKLYTILFFDEANTTENIGLIKEIMCDRRLKGRRINDHVKFIAACNPYRKHTDEMIKKLETAGLGYYVKTDSTQHKFGNIPLRHLVYRVLDLPLSMRPLLYDFGQVTGATEDDYIHQIVTNHVYRNKLISGYHDVNGLIDNISELLAASQSFMRTTKDECSFVSLRDVERAMIVFEWFYENNDFFENLLKDEQGYEDTNRETRSIILTLAVCYHARIQERENFEKYICSKFKPPISAGETISKEKFVKEISSFQGMILSQMDSNIPKNIARNVALKENTFMMLVCIELKIPLFVIGKPGSSKSLAKSIIENSMQGPSSSNILCKKLKQVKLFSYQCSQHSTPSSILEVFNNAKRFQESKDLKQLVSLEKKNTKQFVSVVVLDEVGLAEDSPSLPLKALHPLLEDGTSGADAKVQRIAREDRVAFVGISNWALDPAKMNRGVMITRGSPDVMELEQSARGICSNEKDDPVRDKLDVFFSPLSKAYMKICQKQKREFFGLRDFYSLIKMLYWMVSKTDSPLTEKQLTHAILRNFDGLDEFDATKIFLSHVDSKSLVKQTVTPEVSKQTVTSKVSKQTVTSEVSKQTATSKDSKENKALYPDCKPLGLIKASLDTKDISWHGESRYLLFMTENFAALRVLQQHLLRNEDEPPFVLFGSSFPKDMEYTQVCRNINQIKICMETGRTVILLNLENLYESLYDVLNQYYTKLRENRYVDLGLQSHRIKCRVDDNFKMILIAEKETVYKDFPTPLINRLEKHFVVTSTILTEPQKKIMGRLKQWAEDFTAVTKLEDINKLQLGDAFIGYQEDTPAAVVFQAYDHVKATKQWDTDDKMTKEQKDQIFEKGKSLLLDIASPDAIVRLRYSKLTSEFDTVFDMYFTEQCHSSLFELLSSKLPMSLDGPSKEVIDEGVGVSVPAQKEMLLLQITTHSHLLSEPDVTQLCKALKLKRKNITCFLLQEFDTEMDFCNKLKMVMEQDIVGHKILIIQCDCGHLHSNLIACARHKVIDEIVVPQSSSKEDKTEHSDKAKTEESDKTITESESNKNNKLGSKSLVHVVFIVQLPRKAGGTNFVGFQGGDWLSVHLDDLRPLKENELSFQSAIQCSISEIFHSMYHSFTSTTFEKEDKPMSVEQGIELLSLEQEVESSSLEQKVEPSQLEEELKQSEHAQNQSLSLNVSQSLDVPSSKFQSVTFNANRRLRDLIQMACSWLYDTEQNRERTTKRISILTDLIPTESTKDKSSFDCRLVHFVTVVLEEMDAKNPAAKQWAFEEALKHSQLSGTFRNALSRRLDKILLPILAKIIALIDKNFNLSIIHAHRDSKKISLPIAKLWLKIFSERSLCKISYEDIFTNNNVTQTKKWVPGIGASLSDHFYKCAFPFSWICRDVINIQKRDSAVLAERYNVKHIKKMSELLESSPLGAILNSCVPNDDEEAHKMLCCLYLNDYILSAYKPSMVDEQQLIYEAVYSRFSQLSIESITFLEKLVVLHLAYSELEPQLQQFQQLVSLSPRIVSSVFKKLNEDSDFKNEISDLALCTVKILLIDLKHEKEWNKEQTKQWIKNVSYYQNSINSILNLKTLYDSTKARKDWMRILALKTFAVTIGLHYNDNNTLTALKQLTTFLINPNFKSVNILKNLTRVLTILQTNMKKSWNLKDDEFGDESKQNEIKEYFKFISCCEKYFIEVITNFCFEQTYDTKDPDPAMIDYLIDCIFKKEDNSTKSLTPFSERGGDTVPVVRSYLLQLLIGVKADYMWTKLESYFTTSQMLVEKNDTNLHVLCVQCFEDKHYKNIEKTKELSQHCLNLLKTQMDEYGTVAVFTVQYFNSIATLRFCLSQFSDYLYDWCASGNKVIPEKWLEVLKTVKQLYNSPRSKHPTEYFIKYIVRQHGIQLFNQLKMSKDPSFDWIIPEHLNDKKENDDYVINPAVVYCGIEFFDKFTDRLTLAISSKTTTELNDVIKDMNDPKYSGMIIMAIYANVALKESPSSHADQDVKNPKSSAVMVASLANCSLYPTPLPHAVADYLSEYTTNSAGFNHGLKGIAKDMLHGICRVDSSVIKMQSLQSKQISGVIIHCVTVFYQREDVEFLKPCAELLKRLSSLKDMYLPTMPEVCEFKSDLHLMGTYYICENNPPHRFLVIADDCDKLDVDVVCTCQKKAKVDTSDNCRDEKATGHILGSAASRSKDQVQERNLSPTSCSIMRVFLHAILTWSSSFIDKDNPPNLNGCISPDIPVQHLERFFLRNLEKDLITLSSSLGRSIDDAVLTVHLILKQLSQLPDQDFPSYIGKWSKDTERQKWETDFSEKMIDPVITNIEMELKNTYALAMKDTDTLYSRIYESIEESDPHSALWRYRTRLSLEHLSCSIQTRSYEILNKFLKQEATLRAMQYLPEILKLQRYLFDHFHQQIGQEKALSETIGNYKKTIQKDKAMFTDLVQVFNEAWLLLKNQLKNHGRLRVPLEYVDIEITDDTKLAYLMPTTTGEGICSSSMVDFLVYQHNEFIQFCYKNLPKTYYDPNICQKLLQNTIPLSQLQACHVLNYEHKLIPVILTHCQYSLRYGKGTEVSYDFEAIERDLFDKFIFGKPLILIDEMPRVVFRKDAHDATFYESIMASVPQESLQHEKKKTLITEITKLNPHKLSELLDVVEIVLGFLASAGGKPDQTFHNYITKTLTMQRTHIPKAVKDCTLSTAIALWRIVSVVNCCKLTTLGKEPFDRLDKAYCDSPEKTKMLELQQTFKRIESPIDFLISLHNFIAVFVSHRSPTEDCRPKWRMTVVWKEAMESSCFYHKVDLKSIVISNDILMCHIAAVWKEAVGLLWPKENQQ